MNIQYSNIKKKILVIGTICLLLIINIIACDKKEEQEYSTSSSSIESTTEEAAVESTVGQVTTQASSEEVTTEGIASEKTTTQIPTTQAATVQAPTTQAPTTQTPTTHAPTTHAPTTQAISTAVATKQETSSIETTTENVVSNPSEKKHTGTIYVKSNQASGAEVYSGNGTSVDASNKSNGYIMVKHEGSFKRIKLQITNGSKTYTYDLNNGGTYEAFPLQMGDGTYSLRTLENVSGTSYSILYSIDVPVALTSSLGPYLYPSQRVRFHASMDAVKKSYDLTVGLTTDEEKVNAIYNYVIETVKYDYGKVSNLTSTYLSNADTTLANKAGICLDYSVLMAVMLRAQNIPTQVVYGSATEASWHAWNKIYYNGTWVLKDATFGASGAKGSNYTESQRY